MGSMVGFNLVRIPRQTRLPRRTVVPAFAIEVPSGGGRVMNRP